MKNFEKYIDKITNIDKVACKICQIRKFNCQSLAKRCEEIKVENKKWLLEEYKEPIKLTHDEYVILKNIKSDKYHLISRENDGLLYLYGEKHFRNISFYSHLFQFIKWEDNPYEIAKLIEDYEKENKDVSK